jgi:sec-independent protein translocase protein TatA
MIGGWEMVVILAVILMLFGAKKLPELAKGLGQGIREFKKATREVTDEVTTAMDETPPASQRRLPASPPAPTTPAAPPVEQAQNVPQSPPVTKI